MLHYECSNMDFKNDIVAQTIVSFTISLICDLITFLDSYLLSKHICVVIDRFGGELKSTAKQHTVNFST